MSGAPLYIHPGPVILTKQEAFLKQSIVLTKKNYHADSTIEWEKRTLIYTYYRDYII